jgi:hypothetical protein
MIRVSGASCLVGFCWAPAVSQALHLADACLFFIVGKGAKRKGGGEEAEPDPWAAAAFEAGRETKRQKPSKVRVPPHGIRLP